MAGKRKPESQDPEEDDQEEPEDEGAESEEKQECKALNYPHEPVLTV